LIRDKWLLAFVIINILLVSGGLVVGFYVYRAAGRYLAQDMMFIAPFGFDGHVLYTDDIRDVPGMGLILENRSNMLISRGDRYAAAQVIFCDAGYFLLHFFNFIEGGPWHTAEEDSHVIILNESLAWYLFGGRDVTGLTVDISNISYSIIGVVQQGGAIHMAWLPLGTMSLPVTSIYFRPYPYNPIDARAQVNRLFENLPFSGYVIVDINRYVESINMRHKILLYMVWLWIMALLIWTAQKMMRRRKKLTALLVAAVVGTALLAGVYDILVWLPNLANPDVSIIVSLSNINVLPPEASLPYGIRRASQFNRYANYAWIAGSVGLANLVFLLQAEKLI